MKYIAVMFTWSLFASADYFIFVRWGLISKDYVVVAIVVTLLAGCTLTSLILNNHQQPPSP